LFDPVRRRLAALTWVQRSLLLGIVLSVAWMAWSTHTLYSRALKDTVLFIAIPGALAVTHGKQLGYRVDRRALRNTVLLALFVLPFYVVGSTLPTVREYYPMFGLESLALARFLPHTVLQFVLVLAAETYYRGLLCVGVRELGPISWFISPVAYVWVHFAKPPVELLLSAPTDVLFGAVDYDADSLLPSVVAHAGGFVVLDYLVLHEPILPPQQVLEWLSWVPVPL
jgi:hypothetical protein